MRGVVGCRGCEGHAVQWGLCQKAGLAEKEECAWKAQQHGAGISKERGFRKSLAFEWEKRAGGLCCLKDGKDLEKWGGGFHVAGSTSLCPLSIAGAAHDGAGQLEKGSHTAGEVVRGSGLRWRMTRFGGICSCCQAAPFQGKWWGGEWQPVTSAAWSSDGVNQRHISGSVRCPGGQPFGGFHRICMFFWKSGLSPARFGKERGLSIFCKLKILMTQDMGLWGRLGLLLWHLLGAAAPPGDAEKPSPHNLAPNGAIPHGHILLFQSKPEITTCLSSVCVVPPVTRTFC